jgi:hypothetical protein
MAATDWTPGDGGGPVISLACQWGACDGCPDDECECACHPGERGGATSAWEHHRHG